MVIHNKFLNANLFLIKTFLIAMFDCIYHHQSCESNSQYVCNWENREKLKSISNKRLLMKKLKSIANKRYLMQVQFIAKKGNKSKSKFVCLLHMYFWNELNFYKNLLFGIDFSHIHVPPPAICVIVQWARLSAVGSHRKFK